jgi:hypothetical protein
MARNGFFMQTQFIRCYVSGIDCHPNIGSLWNGTMHGTPLNVTDMGEQDNQIAIFRSIVAARPVSYAGSASPVGRRLTWPPKGR